MKPAAEPFISLSRADISHVDYHWFWGLRYNQVVQTPNMTGRLDVLMQDDGLLQSLREQQARVEGHNFIVRALFRLFNIDNYTHNTYALVFLDAYDVHQAQEKNVMHADATSGTPEEGEQNWQWAQAHMLSFCNLYGLLPVPRYDGATRVSVVSQEAWVDVAQVQVTEKMQPYLRVLGIQANSHDNLTEADVKCAYRKVLRVAHPDKGGSSEAFLKVQAAKKQLDWLIHPEKNLSVFDDEYFSDAINEIIRRYDNIDRVNAETKQMNAETKQMNAETKQMNEETKQRNAETKQRNAETIRICAEIHRRLGVFNQGSNSLERERPNDSNDSDEEEISSSTKPWLMICN